LARHARRQAPATVVALDEEVDRPRDEVELVQKVDAQAGIDQAGDDLAE
jgi:hypothetical protein